MNCETVNPVILVHMLGNLKKSSIFCSTVFEGHNFLPWTIDSVILWLISVNCSVMCCSFLLMNINFKITGKCYFDTTIFLKNRQPQYLFWLINCWSFGSTKPSNTLKMGTRSVPEPLENLHILMWLSAREHFIEFCSCESFKTYIYCVMIQIWSCLVACMLCLVYLKYTTRLQSCNVSFSNIDVSSLIMPVKPKHVGTNGEWSTQ
jgi:hypothetical protein